MADRPQSRSAGASADARERIVWPQDRSFRILSIDGGGIKGILPACLLAELETRFLNRQSIGQYFDLITGTSTGGIIALALAHGVAAREIANIYCDRGDRIFPVDGPARAAFRAMRRIFASAFDPEPLEYELDSIFGDALLGSANTRLCIPAFEGEYGEPFIYKTPHHPDYHIDQHKPMLDVAL